MRSRKATLLCWLSAIPHRSLWDFSTGVPSLRLWLNDRHIVKKIKGVRGQRVHCSHVDVVISDGVAMAIFLAIIDSCTQMHKHTEHMLINAAYCSLTGCVPCLLTCHRTSTFTPSSLSPPTFYIIHRIHPCMWLCVGLLWCPAGGGVGGGCYRVSPVMGHSKFNYSMCAGMRIKCQSWLAFICDEAHFWV